MQKISGIVPANKRTSSAEIEDSQPVRPGVPSFGRKEGRNTRLLERQALEREALLSVPIRDKVTLSSAATAAAAQEPGRMQAASTTATPPTSPRNAQEARHAKIAEDMSKKFFLNYGLSRKIAKANEAAQLEASQQPTQPVLADESEVESAFVLEETEPTSETRYQAVIANT